MIKLHKISCIFLSVLLLAAGALIQRGISRTGMIGWVTQSMVGITETPSRWEASLFEQVSITSSMDGTLQKAYVHNASKDNQPLIVSLHSWSGSYDQIDPLAGLSAKYGFNYIRPDFRGPNNTPQSCASYFALSDIDDAIEYAIEHFRMDENSIYVVGASGGGMQLALSI